MLPKVRFGRTGLEVTRLALGGYPFGGVNLARGWDPFSEEGRATAIETVHTALDAGINLIDTAPGYGAGNSESIIGEATKGRRDQFVLATKVSYHGSAAEVRASVGRSLHRLRTDVIDVIQFHGGMYTSEDVSHIVDDGLLDALLDLRRQGSVRYLGFTVEEPWTAQPLLATGAFDVMQVRYNLIYQSAALHVLNQAREADMGVSTMRTMTSGILQRLASYLAPGWDEAHDLYEVALKFVLSDSRVHVANVGMQLPRMTAHIYQTDDEMHGFGGK
jgi:aryl-alcohol dehydrogenase-like predicted oxidoreductase